MDPHDFKKIIYDKDDATGIVWVTINSPDKKNAFTYLSFLELWQAVEIMEQDDDAEVMILTGAKIPNNDDPRREAFSSGGYFDPSEDGALGKGEAKADENVAAQIDFTDIAQKRLTLKMWQFEKPVIAAINGLAIGAGFTLPLACADFIVASEHAWAQLPFVRIGIVPEFASTFLLPRLLGYQKAKELIYLGERLTAAQLLEKGLINKIVPHDQLLDAAKEMAMQLIPPLGPGQAVRLTKKAMHKPLVAELTAHLDLENEGLNIAIQSSDLNESIMARIEKRSPVYKGA